MNRSGLGFLSCLLVSVIFSFPAGAEYVAYAMIDNVKKPLPESLDNIEAKQLINVKWGKYSGNRSRVGVMGVKNNSKVTTVQVLGYGQTVTYNNGGVGVPVDGIDALLTDVLHRSGRFRLVERTMLNKVLKEQDLGAAGRVSKPSAAKKSKVLGAQYLIQAVVTAYEPNYEGRNIGLGGLTGGLLGGLSIKNSKSMVGMNFRLIDAETSEIVFSKQVNAVMSESGFGFGAAGWAGGGILGGFMSSYSKTPIGQAVIAAINKGAFELIKQVGSKPSSGSVIKATRSKVYLNMGKGRVSPGDTLTVFSKGAALIDPDTGLDLGGEEEEIGSLQVVSVKDKYSIAKPVGGLRKKIKTGYKVVSTRIAEKLQFASAWTTESSSASSDSTDAEDEY